MTFLNEIKEIKNRNKTLKNYLKNRNWDKNPNGELIEFDLIKNVAVNLHKRKLDLKNFKYLYDYEWEVESGRSDEGKRDLIVK